MSIQNVISLIFAPVVMISSSTLFLNGLIQRYESLSARLRAMHAEHIELLRAIRNEQISNECDPRDINNLCDFNRERQKEIEIELPPLLKRHKLLFSSILAAECSIGILVLSMFIIGMYAITHVQWLELVALCSLLIGAFSFLTSVFITSFEFTTSPREVVFEVQNGLHLSR